jgi:hypothetical protein
VRDDEDRQEQHERFATAFRRLPTSIQGLGLLGSMMVLIGIIQSVASVVNTFLATVVAPLIQWCIR